MLFYDWTSWRRSFIQIHYCAVPLAAQVELLSLFGSTLNCLCPRWLHLPFPVVFPSCRALCLSPLLCVHACVFVFVQHRALGWFSHLLIVTLTCRWWSHHRALFNRVAELESMSLNDNSQRDPGSCRRGTYVSSLFLFCPGTTESFSKDFWGNCVWEWDPCTGTSGDHYEGMLFCWNCLHPVSTLNSLSPFRKSCDWVRFLATDLTRTWYSKYKHLLLLMQY